MLGRSTYPSILLIAAALGCGGGHSVGPAGADLAGRRYALRAAEGTPLPLVLWTEPDGASATLLADTLAFAPGGRVTRTRVLRQTDARGAATTETATFGLEYRLRGSSVEIGSFTPCPPNANCVGNDTGTLRPSLLLLSSPMYTIDNRPGQLWYEPTDLAGR